METPRTLPHSIEAEKSVLGSILLSRSAMEQTADVLRPEDFYLPAHQDIYATMLDLYNQNKVIDVVTLVDALDRAGILKAVGDVPYISELSLFTPSAVNVSHYIGIVEERSVLRQLCIAGSDISADAASGEKRLEHILDDAERRIFNISMKKSTDTLKPIQDTIYESYMRIGELMKLKGAITGIPTGFIDLDKYTSGLQRSDLVIIAGRPSMGKTSFALNIAQHAAIREHKTVVIFSLEMSREQLIMRVLCSEARVDMQHVLTGTTSDEELLRIADALEPMSKAPMFIDDSAATTVPEIRSKCRRLKTRHGLDMVIIDYLQLMQSTSKADNRQQEISEITRSLKMLARELNVPILLLSQLSRAPEHRSDHTPMMADLRESGAIEQDADVIILLYRESVYNEDADNTADIIIAKHRNGPTGTVQLAWLGELTTFTNLSYREYGE